MANIKELIQSIESGDSSFDEKLAAINQMEETLVAMREQEQEAVNDNVELIVEAIKLMEKKVADQLEIAKSIVPEKGDKGDKGQDGLQGRDGLNGKDGRDGQDGKNGLDGSDGVSVTDAKIDFDGSLVITLSDGREINVGEVVPVDVAQTIHKIQSGSGGDSQTTLNAIAALQATIATYGTMATQNANNVAITGGTINNTTIGVTTPSTGVFTTLTGNSTSQFGRSSANYLQAVGGASTVAPVISAQGSDTNIPLVLQPKGTGALQAQQTDSTATGGNARGANATDFQKSRFAASQVASGSSSTIGGGLQSTASGYASTIAGGDTNTASAGYSAVLGGNNNIASGNQSSVVNGISNTATGFYGFVGSGFTNSTTANAAVTTQSGTMNGTTAVTLSGSNASIKVGQYIQGTSIASDTYVAAISGTSLTLSKVASGSSTSTLSFYTPHGVVVGGGNNQATGSYSFIGGGGDAGTAANRNVASGDWSVVVGGIKNTASAIGAFVGGGGSFGSGVAGNTASGTSSSVLSGFSNTASNLSSSAVAGSYNSANGAYSFVAAGVLGTTRSITCNHVFPAANNPFGSGTLGGIQASLLCLGKQTTDATASVLTVDGSAASTINQVILPNNSAYAFRGTVIANVTGGGNTKAWAIEGAIKRGANAASTAFVGSPTVTSGFADAGASTWAIAVTADTTNGGLAITFTGQASTTIRCVAKLETTEVTF